MSVLRHGATSEKLSSAITTLEALLAEQDYENTGIIPPNPRLLEAARNNDTEKFDWLIDHGICWYLENHQEAFWWAVHHGNHDMITTFLRLRLNIGDDHDAAVMEAVRRGDRVCLDLMTKYFHLKYASIQPETLTAMCNNGYADIVASWVSARDTVPKIFALACASGDLGVAKCLADDQSFNLVDQFILQARLDIIEKGRLDFFQAFLCPADGRPPTPWCLSIAVRSCPRAAPIVRYILERYRAMLDENDIATLKEAVETNNGEG